MTYTPIESAADYLLLDDKRIAPNEAGEWIKAAYEAALSSHQRLRRCWAGAFLAQLFARRPWLDAARLTLSVSFEYGDDGSYFRTVRCNVMQVRFVEDCALPEAEFPDGEADSDAAAASLENDVEDDAFKLYYDLRGVRHCRIPDDHMAACGTNPGAPGATVSWLASVFGS